MVSTRSSARKPPAKSRPSTAPSRLTSQHDPTPVPDDPPPSHPRRSRRIKFKNADNTSDQPASVQPSLLKSHVEPTQEDDQTSSPNIETGTDHHQHPPQHSPEPSSPALSQDPEPVTPSTTENHVSQHSDDDAPEEIKTVNIQPQINPSLQETLQRTIKKNRRRRQRHRQRAKKENTSTLPTTLPSQPESQLHIDAHSEDPSHQVSERLSADQIAAAQTALEHAKQRRQDAKQLARLENQVKHVEKLSRTKQIGRTKVALASDSFPPLHRQQKKGRQSAASFLASCMQKGPKRVPASKIALMGRATNSC